MVEKQCIKCGDTFFLCDKNKKQRICFNCKTKVNPNKRTKRKVKNKTQ